jgi:hypothetical protein
LVPTCSHRSEDDLVVGEIGGAFIDEKGTIDEVGEARSVMRVREWALSTTADDGQCGNAG